MAESVPDLEKDDKPLLPEDGPKLPSMILPDEEKITKYVDGLAAKAGELNPQWKGCIESAAPIIVLPTRVLMCVAPFYWWAYEWVFRIYEILPKQVVKAIFGLALCFFGGTYVASIAAIEAFRQMGFAKVMEELTVVVDDAKKVAEANEADDKADADGDGIADVQQDSGSELAQRKIFLAMNAIKQPQRLQNAVGSLWASYIAVLATLKLEFARTTAFALGIVEVVKFPVVRLLTPVVMSTLNAVPKYSLEPEQAKDWAISLVESGLVLVSVIFAWYLQMIISAFYSGLRGGKMFAEAVVELLHRYDLWGYIPCIPPFDPEESNYDEILGYTVAALGFIFQFFAGFQLPFPLNVIFLPLTIIEWFLRIQISFTDAGVH